MPNKSVNIFVPKTVIHNRSNQERIFANRGFIGIMTVSGVSELRYKWLQWLQSF